MASAATLVVGLWLFFGGGIWWLVGGVLFSLLVFLGEDVLLRWMFFISVSFGAMWLFFRLVMEMEL